MKRTTAEERWHLAALDRTALQRHQLERLDAMLRTILPHNPFYAQKLDGFRLPLKSLEALYEMPFTTKDELVGSGKPAFGAANRTYPLESYVRFHHTSGTRGRPLMVLDTAGDWQWWIECWQYVLDAAEIGPDDRAMLAFSFGPFIGFWSAHDALVDRGTMVIPGGGMTTLARLELLRTSRATALFCTPSYGLRLAEVAAAEGFDLSSLEVRRVVVAGEPGGSVPAVRAALETAWGARVIDHCGATEVGPWGFGNAAGDGLWVIESELIAELVSLETGEPAGEGELAELVLTSLGRFGCPVVRYRTGDMVRPVWREDGPVRFVFLQGGVLGRVDDMMIVRGVNIFPSSIEEILRTFPEVVEFRMTARRTDHLDQLEIEVEDRAGRPQRIAKALELRLGLKVSVKAVPLGTLPRSEGKSKRFVDLRS